MSKIQRRMRFVSWFHSLFPGKYCWADCVSWAYSKSWNPFIIDNAKGCEQESLDHPHRLCYCGGWKDGKCYDKLTKEEKDSEIKAIKEICTMQNDLPF